MSESVLQSTMRELRRLVHSSRFWAAMAGATMLLGLIGPFGTYEEMRLPARLAYWAAIAVASYTVGFSITTLLASTFTRGEAASIGAYILYGAIAGAPVTLLVWGINTAALDADAIALVPLGAYTVTISAIVSALVALFSRDAGKPTSELAATAAAQKRPRILDRLPAPQRGRLSHMTVQDHYVDVRTDRGGGLVLMRFADAIAETEGVEGVRIHRSHWVATEMVAEVMRVGGRSMVKMADGTLLPVSRSFLDAARKVGIA